jgi:hypothetical protein
MPHNLFSYQQGIFYKKFDIEKLAKKLTLK